MHFSRNASFSEQSEAENISSEKLETNGKEISFSNPELDSGISCDSLGDIEVSKLQEQNEVSFSGILQEYNHRSANHDLFVTKLKKKLQESLVRIAQLEKEIAIKKKLTEKKNSRIMEIELMNLKLQREVVDGMAEVSASIREHCADQDEQNCSMEQPTVGRMTSDFKKFHMGRGVFLGIDSYALAMSNINSNAQFVKNLSVAVFGKEVLLHSTITGKKSGRSKEPEIPQSLEIHKLLAIEDTYRYWLKKEKKMTKEEADWEAHNTFSYISRKIADLKNSIKKKPSSKILKEKLFGQLDGNESNEENIAENESNKENIAENESNEENIATENEFNE